MFILGTLLLTLLFIPMELVVKPSRYERQRKRNRRR